MVEVHATKRKRGQRKNLKEYAVYKGDSLLVSGTAQECADFLNVKQMTIRFWTTPHYKKSVATSSKNNHKIAFCLDNDELDE